MESNTVISIIPVIAGGSLDPVSFSKEEYNRYNRHIIIRGFGIEGQLKLKAAKVLAIGVGGLGSFSLL